LSLQSPSPRRSASAIRSILFDLGGVLVRFRGIQRVAEWLEDGEAGDEHWRRWLRSATVRGFERGRLTPEEFADAFLDEFRLDLGPAELLRELHDFIGGPLEGALELLDELRPRYLVACLSNTNRLHWPGMFRRMGLLERFERAFVSCETGFLKPDPEAFEHVCRELDLPPREILFFDDARLNVEAARALGFAACRALGPADCRRELERRGLLPV
jgi:HAD superfamily hydrolase (TIGR01509 family)